MDSHGFCGIWKIEYLMHGLESLGTLKELLKVCKGDYRKLSSGSVAKMTRKGGSIQ